MRRVARVRRQAGAVWAEPRVRLGAIAVVVLGAAAAVLLALAATGRPPSPTLVHDPITVGRTLSPATALFGDELTAVIEVTTRDAAVDPGSVRVTADFRPYRVVETTVERARAGAVSLVRTRFALRCLTAACLPSQSGGRLFQFEPATVDYRVGAAPRRVDVPWTDVQVHSRLGPQSIGLVDAPPAVDHGTWISPPLARWILALAAVALGLTGAWLVLTGLWPRSFYSLRRWRRLTPLQRAVCQLDAAAQIDDEAVRRQVLDQLATRLGEADLTALERRSRDLAWSETPPDEAALAALGAEIEQSLNGGAR